MSAKYRPVRPYFVGFPRQDPHHTTEWESLTNGWYALIPNNTVYYYQIPNTVHHNDVWKYCVMISCLPKHQLVAKFSSYIIEIEWWQSFHYIYHLHCIWQSLVFEVITCSLCNTWFVLWPGCQWKPGFWIYIQLSLWPQINECIQNMIIVFASICFASKPNCTSI